VQEAGRSSQQVDPNSTLAAVQILPAAWQAFGAAPAFDAQQPAAAHNSIMLSSSDTEHSVHGASSPDEQHQDAPRKLAVLGLPWDTTEETLMLHFSQYGAVEATDIMKDRLSGKSRGFGFVTFADAAAAARALQVDHTIDGRRCEAKVALPKVRSDARAVLLRWKPVCTAVMQGNGSVKHQDRYQQCAGALQCMPQQ
jgi:RNA recognition motif-containing protein